MNVEKGSVGIGGSQTGIYPNNSPGGWQIIGKTPIDLFDINRNNPCLVKPGDKISFHSISKKEFQLITVQEKSGIYKLKKNNK
jgi:inhibitor of KinA